MNRIVDSKKTVSHYGSRWLLVVLFAVTVIYVLAVAGLNKNLKPRSLEEMQIALPRFLQVALSGGDRFLAANLGAFRAVVASTENMREEHYQVQARVQRDVAWLNPAHEDNYYVAAAILPWNDHYEAAQEILSAAVRARPFDYQPAFFYAFNLYQIKRNAVAAADALLRAAPNIPSERERYTMESLAYRWYEKGYDPATSLRLLEVSAQSARSGAFKRYLLQRAERLRGLLILMDAAEKFESQFDRHLRSLEELTTTRVIDHLPQDPFGLGYELSAEGKPILSSQPRQRKK